jgi:septum formation protein
MDHLKERRLILGSKSPRRNELMAGLGLPFIVKTQEVEENFPASMAPFEVASYIAQKKAKSFRQNLEVKDLLITADTVVIIKDEILNKPNNKEEAMGMLQKLSGKIHQVVTGVCMMDVTKTVNFEDLTEVHFKEMEERELKEYVEKFQPYDKAGAYGVQEWIGYVAVYKMVGSFYNVMGLPVHRIYEELKKW